MKREDLRYKCNFCGEIFKKCSECVKHIENKSIAGIVFPSDVILIDISKIGGVK